MRKLRLTLLSSALLPPLLLSAAVTVEHADSTVLEYIQREVAWDYALLRNDNPPGADGRTSVTWSNRHLHAESFGVEYPCWVYFIANPTVQAPHPILFLFVSKEDGGLLEVKNRCAYSPHPENWTEIAKTSSAAAQEKTPAWDYPVKPGTAEWGALTHRQLLDTCQIPAAVLQDLSTPNLLNLCLRYPFLEDVFTFNFIAPGLDKLFADFNGIREFSQREDALQALLSQYESDYQHISMLDSDTSAAVKVGYAMKLSMLEYLLCYPQLHSSTPEDMQKNMLQHLWICYQQKCHYPDYFQSTGFSSNLLSRAYLIDQLNKELLPNNWSTLYSIVAQANAALRSEIDERTCQLIGGCANACGVAQPQTNLPWLAELIAQAEEATGEYEGFIWLEKYKYQDVFVTDIFKLSARAYHVFDCQGSDVTVDQVDAQEFFNHLENVIYTSPHYSPTKDADTTLQQSSNATELPTGVQDAAGNGASLQQNVPNPFSQSTVIRYALPPTGNPAQLVIRNTAGTIVRQIPLQPGTDSVTVEGDALASGLYFYALYTGSNLIDTKQMILTK